MSFRPSGYFGEQEDSSDDELSSFRRPTPKSLHHDLDPVYSVLKIRIKTANFLMPRSELQFVTSAQIREARLEKRNPLRFMDEVSGRVRGGIIDWLEGTNLLKMSDIERFRIKNWYLPTIQRMPNNPPSFSTIIEYKSKYLDLLKKFGRCEILGVDLKVSCTSPRVPVIIQLTSWQFGTILVYVDVLQRDDKMLLKEIFQNPCILKIGFDVWNDVAALKLFGIYPTAFIDLQIVIERQLQLIPPPSLALCSNVLIGEILNNDMRGSLFEKRVKGSLPDDLKLYAVKDSIAHLCCFYSFVRDACVGDDGKASEDREQELLSKINLYYKEQMVNILINVEPKITPSTKEVERHAFWAQNYEEILSGLEPDTKNLAEKLHNFRIKMHKHCGLLSPFDLIPNGLLFHFALNKPLYASNVLDTINSWREEVKIPPTNYQLKNGLIGFNVQPSGPLHATVGKNYYSIYQIIWGFKTVEEIVSRLCKRCKLNSCVSYSTCEGKRAGLLGQTSAIAKAAKKNLSINQGASSHGISKGPNKRTRRRLSGKGYAYDKASGLFVPVYRTKHGAIVKMPSYLAKGNGIGP